MDLPVRGWFVCESVGHVYADGSSERRRKLLEYEVGANPQLTANELRLTIANETVVLDEVVIRSFRAVLEELAGYVKEI